VASQFSAGSVNSTQLIYVRKRRIYNGADYSGNAELPSPKLQTQFREGMTLGPEVLPLGNAGIGRRLRNTSTALIIPETKGSDNAKARPSR
jgi:hypothetical protein